MNPLYEFVSSLKERINRGEISGHTALDLFYQHVFEDGNQPIRPASATPVPDSLWDQRTAHSILADLQGTEGVAYAADPVPEPASEEPVDGQTTDAETE